MSFSAWNHYKPIGVRDDQVDADLTGVPVLVKLAGDADLGKALSDGSDIRFALGDGTAEVPYHRLAWSGGGGSAVTAAFYVLVPRLAAAGGASLRIYYDNADAEDANLPAAVWADAEAVLPLGEAAGPFLDATGHGHNGTDSATAQGDGVVAKGRVYDAASDRIVIADHDALEGMDALSLECWFYCTGQGTTQYSILIEKSYNSGNIYFIRLTAPDSLRMIDWRVGASGYTTASGAFTKNTWNHVLAVYQRGGVQRLWVNGTLLIDAAAGGVAVGVSAHNIGIGARATVNDYSLRGTLEGVRFWRSAAVAGNAAAYARFHHANVTSADHELTWGAEANNAASVPPYRVSVKDIFSAGASAGVALVDGAVTGEVFQTGVAAGEIDGRAD